MVDAIFICRKAHVDSNIENDLCAHHIKRMIEIAIMKIFIDIKKALVIFSVNYSYTFDKDQWTRRLKNDCGIVLVGIHNDSSHILIWLYGV